MLLSESHQESNGRDPAKVKGRSHKNYMAIGHIAFKFLSTPCKDSKKYLHKISKQIMLFYQYEDAIISHCVVYSIHGIHAVS